MDATHALETANLIWGLDAKLLAIIIVSIAYLIIFTEKVNRAIVALLGAAVMIISGILTQKQALAGVDFNTLALLIGMMIIVAITENPDCFSLWQFGALKKLRPVRADY